MKIKNVFIPIITLALSLGVFYKWTLGFRAFTVFSYTLEKANSIGKEFPPIELINQDSVIFNLKDQYQYKLVNFVYLSCPSVCHKVNNRIEDIYHQIDSTVFLSQIQFVTISFDLDNDNVQKIKNYRRFFGENIDGWNFALPFQTNEEDFNQFLKNIGVWIYEQAATKIINHSTYLYLLSPNNQIIKIFDPNRVDNSTIVNEINLCLEDNLYAIR